MNYLGINSFPSNKNLYLTKTGLDNLKEQLDHLRKEKTDLCRRLLGMDDSEKKEYILSTNAYTIIEKIDLEVEKIKDILLRSRTVQGHKKHGFIELGSTVNLKHGRQTVEYTLVNSIEANPFENLISDESPLGKALIGKKRRSIVNILSPNGKSIRYRVLAVS